MKFYISLMISIVLLSACKTDKNESAKNKKGIHEVVAQEVIQVKDYTYMRVLEDGKEKWLAVPSFQAEVGKTYYFKNGMEMPNFESRELKRTFPTIYFVEGVSTNPNANPIQNKVNTVQDKVITNTIDTNTIDLSSKSKPKLEKKEIKIKPISGAITINQLYKDAKQYEGKIVKIKGEVTKFNPKIMNKNWIHIQDGTEYNGKFDLTLVTNAEAKVGDVIVIEGKVSLNKDFGYGYFYELIVENATLVE
ncbi:hypothetical protein [Lutibacter sp.]